MVTLSLLDQQYKTPVKQWCFEHSTVIRIGRAVDNHVVVNDSLVSRYHLEIKQLTSGKKGDTWQVISQGTNGTFLNGILITKSTLPDNSVLQLAQGGPVLKFHIEDIPQATISPWSSPPPENESLPFSRCQHEGNSPDNIFCIHCGQPIKVLKQIHHYQILRTLGQGGMGTTYLAWDATGQSTGVPQLLVLKQMNADMLRIAKAQELFEREAKTLQSLHFPGIPKYYDFFVEAGKKYLAMELIHGQDLEKKIYNSGPVTPHQAITWMIQTCEILDYLHNQEQPLIHRDIKPANLMVRNANNQIVVLDFGAVKEAETKPGTRIGAQGYCAPEQERGQPLIQSDLYAIGPTLIFLLTGKDPLDFFRKRGKSFGFDITNVPTITPQLRQVIECVTQTLPRDRYQNAQELSKALMSITS